MQKQHGGNENRAKVSLLAQSVDGCFLRKQTAGLLRPENNSCLFSLLVWPLAVVRFLLCNKTSMTSTFLLKIITESLGLSIIGLLAWPSIRQRCRD